MGFVWVTDVSAGADIDAADRNETKTHIGTLYTTLGKNWPGNVRFPACGGAGYDMGAPCPVVWDIAAGDDIYQTPGAHPVSELQEARDKLDWIDDNKCGADNIGHDNPENGAANPTTQSPAQSTEDAITQAVAQITEDLTTQDAANPATQFEDQMGNVAECPDHFVGNDGDYANHDTPEDTGDDSVYEGYYLADLNTNKTIDEDLNQSGDEYQDWGVVQHSDYETENVPDYTPNYALDDLIVDGFVYGVAYGSDREEDNTHHCSSEHAAVRTYVQYHDFE